MAYCLILVLFYIAYETKQITGSYLDAPRIHFAGKFRADVNTRNNRACNFDPNNPLSEHDEWNFQGTSEWEFVDTVVTSVVDGNGEEITDSPLLGAKIFSNENRPFAKLVDIDVEFQVSSLYGLELGLKYRGENLFVGKWSTSVIVYDMWPKMKCTSEITDPSGRMGAQSTTKLTDVVWSQSETIKALKATTERQGASGELAVSISIDLYRVDVFLFGRVSGTIGAAMTDEPLNVGGERRMEPVDPGALNFPSGHPCYGLNVDDEKPWTYGTPFKVDSTQNVLIADLSNTLPRQQNGDPLDLGTLYFGVLVDGVVEPFGESIPYTDLDGALWRQSGVIRRSIGADVVSDLENSKLVVFIDSDLTTGGNTYPVKKTFSSQRSGEMVSLVLQEIEYFVRPKDYYMDRLEYSSGSERHPVKSTSDFTLLVTQFGRPVNNTHVTMIDSYNEALQSVLPLGAVSPVESTKTTDSHGHVTFTLAVNQPIPEARHYVKSPCVDDIHPQEARKHGKLTPLRREFDPNLFLKGSLKDEHFVSWPVDGQLYNFYYCVGDKCTLPDIKVVGPFFLYKALISILAFSTVSYEAPYTWEDHVQPIFEQAHHLHYIMRTVLDLSNFTEVTLPHNIELLKKVFHKPITDPNYMPQTRDLSPTKRLMILAWLDDPIYSRVLKKHIHDAPVCDTSSLPPKMRLPDFSHFRPPRCLLKNIPFKSDPETQDSYFNKVVNYAKLKADACHPPRPLFALGFDKEDVKIANILKGYGYTPLCTVSALQKQLQNAVLLEFYTLPLYLTSMYTIVENCNTEAYQAIRDIVIQEMLHLVQSANILISIGGQVIIDDPNYVPSYPSEGGLPGGVLPGLEISLERFNLRHVYDTMMAIETPILTYVARPEREFMLYTIGQFYKEISVCIHYLGDDIFDASTAERQVRWPWTEPGSVGTVRVVTDVASAKSGIDQIVEQGEGEGPLIPNQVATGQYGHFYRFEEIVCQRRLVQKDDNSYAYDGAPIDYNPSGVYAMRDNPSSDTIVFGTDCHREAKAFHRTYRSFLRVLQEAFDGHPHKIHKSVELMEALQVHAKRCIWTPYGHGNTCGPVWDYEWE